MPPPQIKLRYAAAVCCIPRREVLRDVCPCSHSDVDWQHPVERVNIINLSRTTSISI